MAPAGWPTELDARYELLEEAGRGGMGVVYKARDRETGELVAIKVLKPEIAADRQSPERFINEVRLSRRITHKNVCRVYEFTRTGSTAYLSMEFVDGESLRSILSRLGSVNLRKGVQIARQICSALGEAHAQGIIHRDLKPENVMLDRSGNVKVMDFGIARLLDAGATSTGGVMGTPAYMAPEQAESRGVDGRTDIYALGLIQYELFTGQTAFTGETPVAIALKQIRETPPPPRAIDASLPQEVDAIVMRCLEKDPGRRYQTVTEVDDALAAVPLQHAAAAAPITATPAQTWPTVATPEPQPALDPPRASARRLPGRGTILAAAAAVVLLAAAVAYVTLLRTRDAIPFTAFTLNNGLQVIVSEDRTAPTVAVVVTYAVGSRDERAGRRGFAHLFEHMMFAGSLNVGKGEHVALVSNYGGLPSGVVGYDATQFWQTLPANQLDLALFLEADRMRSLKLEQARLDGERATVLAEIAQRKDNSPYGRVNDTLFARAYDTPGYQRDTLGSSDDVRAATLQDVSDFFKIYYAPNNAVLTIVGDVDPDDVKARVRKWFEHIPAQPPPPAPDLSEPPPTAERRVTLEDPFAPQPRVYVAYKGPAGTSPDWAPLQVLLVALGEGQSARLNQKLARESGAVTSAGAGPERRAGAGLATFVLLPAPNRDAAAVLTQFDAILKEVVERGLTDVELTWAKRRLELQQASGLQTTQNRAVVLGHQQSRFGDAAYVNRQAAQLAAVTNEDVRRVAAEYLKQERRTILDVVPAPAAAKPAPPPLAATAAAGAASQRFNKAPVSKDVLRVSLPRTRDFSLDNGLAVQVAEMRRVALVAVRFDIRGAGPTYEPADEGGLALMTAVMLRSGTAERSSRQIAEELDRLGATFTVGTASDPGGIVVSVTGLPDTFDRWFPVVAEILVRPSFPADELTLAKRSFGADMAARRSVATNAAADLLLSAVSGSTVPVIPSPQMLTRLNRDRLAAWHRERWVPQNTIVSIAGAVDPGDAEPVVRSALSGWTRTAFVETAPQTRPPDARGVHVLHRPGSVQTALMLGGAAPVRAESDYLPMLIANMTLGGMGGSRMFRSLREERGLSHNATSNVVTYRTGGFWLMYGDVATHRTAEAVDVMLAELKRLSQEPISSADIDDARRAIVGRFALNLEQLPQIATNLALRRVEGLSADYWDRFPDAIQAVTAEDIRRVAAKYLDVARAQVVAVGNQDDVIPLLKPYGPILIYDSEGKLIEKR